MSEGFKEAGFVVSVAPHGGTGEKGMATSGHGGWAWSGEGVSDMGGYRELWSI